MLLNLQMPQDSQEKTFFGFPIELYIQYLNYIVRISYQSESDQRPRNQVIPEICIHMVEIVNLHARR